MLLRLFWLWLDGGIDARIRGIKIVSLKEKEMGLNRDILENKDMLMRYPKLEEFTTNVIYQKALVLQRSIGYHFRNIT